MSTTSPGGASPVAESIHWLHRIEELPVALGTATRRRYAAMKLGDHASAERFARQLTPLASSLVRSLPADTRWVLTAPPLRNIPAGANIICSHLYRHLRAALGDSGRVTELDLTTDGDARDRSRHNRRYSAMSFAERLRTRRREGSPQIEPGNLQGRAVMFVNDICVTGAQQRLTRNQLAACGPLAIFWLYLVHVDPGLGQRHPQVEEELNCSAFQDDASFGRLLGRASMQFTGKCLVRLFTIDETVFRKLIRRLDDDTVARLAALASEEGRLDSPGYDARLRMLSERAGRASPGDRDADRRAV